MRLIILSSLLIILLNIDINGQDLRVKGVPKLNNYSPLDYSKAGKIWDIESAPNGIVYMASNSGLIEFDGIEWSVYQGSKGVTRSLKVINDSLIYSGSDLDFGIWKKKKNGNFIYKSLYPFKNEIEQGIEEFWNIYQINENIFFISSQNIYYLRNGQLTKIAALSKIQESFALKNTIFIQDKEKGLQKFENYKFVDYHPKTNESNYVFKGVYEQNGNLYFITKNSGILRIENDELIKVKSEFSKIIEETNVFSFELISNKYLAIGTVFKGLFIVDKNGKILHRINKYKGLQNNTVLSIHYASNGKLWAGLDYGVSCLNLKSTFTYFNDFRGEFGNAYTAKKINSDFFLGTNQGLFHSKWENLCDHLEFYNFKLIPGTEGQVWDLYNLGNELLIGHDKGLLKYSEGSVEIIDSKIGVWVIKKLNNHIITGTYNGIFIYKKEGQKWVFRNKLKNISGSCKQLIFQNDSVLWINIPKFAIVKLIIDENLNLKKSTIIQEYDSLHRIMHLGKNNNSLYLKVNNKYKYVLKNNIFKKLNNSLQQLQDKALLSSYFSPVQLTENYEFHPIYNGFAIKYLNQDSNFSISNLKPKIEVEVFNNQGKKDLSPNDEVQYKYNNIRLKFVLPNYDNVLYQYKLSESDDWSEPVKKNRLEFYDLAFGKYNIQIKAKINSETSTISTFSFSVLKPKPLTWQAFILYFLILIILITLNYLRHKKVLAKHKKKLQLEKEKTLEQQEEKYKKNLLKIELQQLKSNTEQLKEQLRSKTVELANKSKDNIEINKLLFEIKTKLSEINNKPRLSDQKIRETIKMLDKHINKIDNTFEIQMDELHQEFFKKLKVEHPDLSANDLKLCAYLKVGLSSKEISKIMDIKLSSSYINRSRLRKKLNLDADENLYDYLNSI